MIFEPEITIADIDSVAYDSLLVTRSLSFIKIINHIHV